jgi:hypothetical protein
VSIGAGAALGSVGVAITSCAWAARPPKSRANKNATSTTKHAKRSSMRTMPSPRRCRLL